MQRFKRFIVGMYTGSGNESFVAIAIVAFVLALISTPIWVGLSKQSPKSFPVGVYTMKSLVVVEDSPYGPTHTEVEVIFNHQVETFWFATIVEPVEDENSYMEVKADGTTNLHVSKDFLLRRAQAGGLRALYLLELAVLSFVLWLAIVIIVSWYGEKWQKELAYL